MYILPQLNTERERKRERPKTSDPFVSSEVEIKKALTRGQPQTFGPDADYNHLTKYPPLSEYKGFQFASGCDLKCPVGAGYLDRVSEKLSM